VSRRIGRFVVQAEIGRGGMGVVYRAEDPALGRAVALKLLPPEVSRAFHAREQLMAEARAAAVLDHPNICTVYDVGESGEGDLYLAMALYEGQTLAERLAQGRLTLADATDVAIQIAQGLSAAHAIGIVHRDIKPSNVMLTRGGLVKILDFGIARAMTDPDVTGGGMLGTPRYMAPEQLDGAPDLDGSVDAWGLGVIFYEMLTGRPPFDAAGTQALMRAIFLAEPAEVGADVYDFWSARPLIAGLLEKDRARRMTIAGFLARASRPVVPEAEAPRLQSLAVLPFRHLGADADGEFFADGLTAEIIGDLSKIRGLRVTSWTSVRRFRDPAMGARDLARELDVHYVLEGSVRRAGRDLRITAHLVDATSDAEIWSGKYAGTTDDVFDIQERVAEAIFDGLRIAFARESTPGSARPIADARAYDLYLRARGEIWSFTEAGPGRAIGLIDEALGIVGPNAALLAARATALWQLVNVGASPLPHLIEAVGAAQQALALDAASVPALRVLALITAMRGDTATADDLLGRALAAAPSDPETLSTACFFYALVGDGERAAALGRRATELDPLYAVHWTGLAFAYASLGRHDDAAAAARRAFEVDPKDLPTQAIAPLVLYGRGDLERIVTRIDAPSPGGAAVGGYASLARLTRAALSGDHARVASLVTPDVERLLGAGLHNALYAAEIFTLVGDHPRALAFLKRAADQGLGCYPLVATHSRTLAPLRSAPGFSEILANVEATWRKRV
jgi:TolB-like protein/tetratricopeptide (TPR) repeat protein